MSDPLERLVIGRSLVGRYTVEEVIGRGGMSIVYRARDERLSRPIALKILRLPAELGEVDREELRERLRREAAAAAGIPPHPNVVQIYDYGTDPDLDLDFIAMELLRGDDLKERLRGGLGVGEAKRILIEAARGVAAGHRVGIVHRDVKPANVFLTGDLQLEMVKILDFGIARAFGPELMDDELTRDGRIPHSPAYAAPEQLDRSRPVTPASDIYQLGLVAYEALAGDRPFTEEERARIRAGERIAIPARGRWAELPPELRAVVERALEPDPERRFPDAAGFAAALDAAAPDDAGTLAWSPPAHASDDATLLASEPEAPPSVVRTAPPPPEPSRPSRASGPSRPADLRRPALAAAALAALALLVWAAVEAIGPAPGDSASADAPLDADAPQAEAIEGLDPAELDEEFRDLVVDAFENLTDAVSEEEGEDAAAAVQATIGEIQQSWVHGDLDTHLGFYADRVDFRGDEDVDREAIGSARGESIERYPEREISIDGMAIRFIAPGRALALVDRRWTFEGEERWSGSARDEMVLERTDGEWLVVSERELESFPAEVSSS